MGKHKFKGKSVWVEVQELSNRIGKSGMISLRYSNDENAKIYRGSVHNLDDYEAPKEESQKQIKKQRVLVLPRRGQKHKRKNTAVCRTIASNFPKIPMLYLQMVHVEETLVLQVLDWF